MVSLSKIHPFPARMAPSIVDEILRKKEIPLRILDPMSGSGVTLATAASLGHQAIGVDTDPLAVLLCSSLTMNLEVQDVVSSAESVLSDFKELWKSINTSSAYPEKADLETLSLAREDWTDFYVECFKKSCLLRRAKEQDCISTMTGYGVAFPSTVCQGRLFACQFHPEKSQELGRKLLENFAKL